MGHTSKVYLMASPEKDSQGRETDCSAQHCELESQTE